MAMPQFEDITISLRGFSGGRKLSGIQIFHDFDWNEKFERRTFKNGLRLTSLVRSDCPAGSTPSLILLSGPDVSEGVINEPPNYALIINIDTYIARATPDAAAAYFTLRRGADTRLEIASALARDSALRDDVIINNLTASYIMTWVGANAARTAEIRALLDQLNPSTVPADATPVDPAMLLDLLSRIDAIPETLASTMIATLQRYSTASADHSRALLEMMLSSTRGRNLAAVELGSRIAERIQDIRDALRVYEALINNPTTTETDIHQFIIDNPWLLGADYVRARHEQPLSRGRLDLVLERYDGHHDIVELKSPNHRVILSASEGDTASSPTQFRLSPELSNAIAQVSRYLHVLERDNQFLPDEYGIQNARHPKAFILIGKTQDFSHPELETLQQMNRSLHGIEILTFDALVLKCDAMLMFMERNVGPSHASCAEYPPPTH